MRERIPVRVAAGGGGKQRGLAWSAVPGGCTGSWELEMDREDFYFPPQAFQMLGKTWMIRNSVLEHSKCSIDKC